jgi:membrane protein CcdC involved in cytochrome C biogenesis
LVTSVVNFPDLYARYQPIIRPLLRVSPVVGGIAILAWRVRETRVPLSRQAIVIPPLAMSTGFGMFFSPMLRVPWSWAVGALLFGLLVLSWPLVRSSRLELREGVVYMRRSRAFLAILLGLLAIRIALHDYIGHLISPLQTAALFYLMAFGMIVRWRVGMYLEYQRIVGRGDGPAA